MIAVSRESKSNATHQRSEQLGVDSRQLQEMAVAEKGQQNRKKQRTANGHGNLQRQGSDNGPVRHEHRSCCQYKRKIDGCQYKRKIDGCQCTRKIDGCRYTRKIDGTKRAEKQDTR